MKKITKYGEIGNIGIIINEYEISDNERKTALQNEILKKVKQLCESIENKNRYMEAYINNLEESFIMGGLEGLAVQIGYIISNFRAKTENDKKIKQELKKIYKTIY